MTKKEFNTWLQNCEIDKDGKYTSLLSADCLYKFYKEALKQQLTLTAVVNSMPTFKDINNLKVGESIFETEKYKILKR